MTLACRDNSRYLPLTSLPSLGLINTNADQFSHNEQHISDAKTVYSHIHFITPWNSLQNSPKIVIALLLRRKTCVPYITNDIHCKWHKKRYVSRFQSSNHKLPIVRFKRLSSQIFSHTSREKLSLITQTESLTLIHTLHFSLLSQNVFGGLEQIIQWTLLVTLSLHNYKMSTHNKPSCSTIPDASSIYNHLTEYHCPTIVCFQCVVT